MRQLFQSLETGEVSLAEVPVPRPRPGHVLVRTRHTLISLGTERMLLEFGQSGWIGRARQQPERVRQVLESVRNNGLGTTIERVRSKMATPLPLGYCQTGVVEAAGAGVRDVRAGMRVVTNGPHAELVLVPANLCAAVPDGVEDETACFTVPAAIGLQAVRLVAPTLGETVVVVGLGLMGLLTAQLLRANGCRVLGFDPDAAKLALARPFGVEAFATGDVDPVATVLGLTREIGADAVIITASTRSDEPMRQAPRMCRQRGRVVLLGDVGLNLARADFYAKEISFQVSCSYGPGRYDPNYEDKGLDYPIGFVRWTEQRNFQAVLELMRERRLDVTPLVSQHVSVADAPALYAKLSERPDLLGVVLDYPDTAGATTAATAVPAAIHPVRASMPAGAVTIGMIGAGAFAGSVLAGTAQATGARLKTVVSAGGVSARHVAQKFGFEQAGAETDAVFDDPEIDTVIVATRHASHAALVERALLAGKHCFVEKPLAVTADEIDRLAATLQSLGPNRPLLAAGFNRRFAPLTEELYRRADPAAAPLAMVMTVNAGALALSHWTQDMEEGGGRLVGEGCHYLDLLRHLARAPVEAAEATFVDAPARDTFSVNMRFANGSIGTVHYFANGSPKYPKERVEVFTGGRIHIIDNFRRASFERWIGPHRQDKGHRNLMRTFIERIRQGGAEPIPVDELFEIARLAVALSADGSYRR